MHRYGTACMLWLSLGLLAAPASAQPAKGWFGFQIAIDSEGWAVVGRKARELQPPVEKTVGEPVHLKLRRPTGETFSVKLVAVARPESK